MGNDTAGVIIQQGYIRARTLQVKCHRNPDVCKKNLHVTPSAVNISYVLHTHTHVFLGAQKHTHAVRRKSNSTPVTLSLGRINFHEPCRVTSATEYLYTPPQTTLTIYPLRSFIVGNVTRADVTFHTCNVHGFFFTIKNIFTTGFYKLL